MTWERIGAGRTAEIFAIDTQRAWKLFLSAMNQDIASEEARIAHAVAATGVPAPSYLGQLAAAGRPGLLYERIHGSSLDAWVGGNPARLPRAARILAETHLRVHQGHPSDLPALHDLLARRIQRATQAPQHVREAALARLAALPRGDTLCHGDFHWGNILLGKATPVVIDWENASVGDPHCDIARTLLLLQMGHVSEKSPLRRATTYRVARYLIRAYLRHYRRATPLDMERLAAWRLPVVVARLSEGIDAEEPQLMRLATRLAGT